MEAKPWTELNESLLNMKSISDAPLACVACGKKIGKKLASGQYYIPKCRWTIGGKPMCWQIGRCGARAVKAALKNAKGA